MSALDVPLGSVLIRSIDDSRALTASFLFAPVISDPLGHRSPSLSGWAFVAAAALLWFADALEKRWRR